MPSLAIHAGPPAGALLIPLTGRKDRSMIFALRVRKFNVSIISIQVDVGEFVVASYDSCGGVDHANAYHQSNRRFGGWVHIYNAISAGRQIERWGTTFLPLENQEELRELAEKEAERVYRLHTINPDWGE